jgi:transposase
VVFGKLEPSGTWVPVATVSRLLRPRRETGFVQRKQKGGNNPRRLDLDWLRKDLEERPDARLMDRVAAWAEHSGKIVHSEHDVVFNPPLRMDLQKKRLSPASETDPTYMRNGKNSSPNSRTSTRKG